MSRRFWYLCALLVCVSTFTAPAVPQEKKERADVVIAGGTVVTMDPARRILRLVTLDDAATADELFSVLMGEDVEARRAFIQRNAKDVRFLDI